MTGRSVNRALLLSVLVVAAPYDGARTAWDERPAALHEALAPLLRGQPAEPAGRIARSR